MPATVEAIQEVLVRQQGPMSYAKTDILLNMQKKVTKMSPTLILVKSMAQENPDSYLRTMNASALFMREPSLDTVILTVILPGRNVRESKSGCL